MTIYASMMYIQKKELMGTIQELYNIGTFHARVKICNP